MLAGSISWTWVTCGDGHNVVIDALDPNYVFFDGGDGGVSMSSDRGLTVARSAAVPDHAGGIGALASNGLDSTLYYGTSRLWISNDRGLTWTAPGAGVNLTKGPGDWIWPGSLAVSAANRNVIYTGSFYGRVMVSQDAGVTWSDGTATLPTAGSVTNSWNVQVTSIVIDPLTPSTASLRSADSGLGVRLQDLQFRREMGYISGNLPNVQANAFLIDPLNPSILYVGTETGVFVSTNGGQSWISFNTGMPAAIVNAFAALPTGLIRVGTYGRGMYERTLASSGTLEFGYNRSEQRARRSP